MANSFGTETPPAPGPDGSNALMSGGMGASAPAQAPQGAAPGQPQQQQQMPAPPSHAQTVAALRHFDAVRKELDIILADPALGRSSVKKKIIDGVTRLVAQRYITPSGAVDQLASVPQEPLMQMKWAKGMMAQAENAERSILMHHAIGFAGGGPEPTPQGDDHLDQMDSVAANFRPRKNG